MKTTTIALVLMLLPLSLIAQTPSNKQQDEMKKLSFLVGKWQGEGWIQMGPDKRESFNQTEDVQMKLGGLLLLIEGVGKSKNPEAAGQIVHNAVALASFDAAAGDYLWRAYTKDGRTQDVRAKLTGDKSLEWGFTMPQGGSIRYTIKIDAQDRWTEIGEFSRDGTTWMKNFEMVLQKAK